VNDLWENLVNSGSEEKLQEENEKLSPILDEINEIKNDAIRSFVRSVLLKAETFWTIPASFSGKHHPPDEFSPGGNVLHTKRVVRIAKLICEAQERDSFEADIMIAAALLHDLTKGHQWEDNVTYDPLHPITADRFVELARIQDQSNTDETSSTTCLIEDELVFAIMRLVRCSHGIWSAIPEIMPVTQIEWNVHLADLIASNLHLITDREVLEERWVGTESVSETD
jgi:23S rRNA maturation-related 3'-5' exoribonuclease YhaM